MSQIEDVAQTTQTDFIPFILSPAGIRSRAHQIYQRALSGATQFQVNEDKLAEVTEFVLHVILANYPDKQVPYHSRWRHFEVGDHAQLKQLDALGENLDELDKARMGLDLILPSVLIDAGAGPDWRYASINTLTVGRSEGLGLASLDMFLAGELSHQQAVATTSEGLAAMTPERFSACFKVSDANPLVGVAGRVQLLKSLGEAMVAQPEVFPNQRPGDLVDYVLKHYQRRPTAENILQMVLRFFGNIWPGRIMLDGVNLGDTWSYSPMGDDPAGFIPFHKLSQWISYSIIETLVNNGFTVTGVEALTGLAEYRNGGLMLDSGLISLRDPSCAQTPWAPASDIIIEWRALTICLLDSIAQEVTTALDTTAQEFPLAKVLQGGTWEAGRKLAMQKRNNLSPPLQIISDATVF